MEKYIEGMDCSRQALFPLHAFTRIVTGRIKGTTILTDGKWNRRVKVPFDHFKAFIESPSQRILYVGTMEIVQHGDIDFGV